VKKAKHVAPLFLGATRRDHTGEENEKGLGIQRKKERMSPTCLHLEQQQQKEGVKGQESRRIRGNGVPRQGNRPLISVFAKKN